MIKGHNYDHGKGDICKKCGKLHIRTKETREKISKTLLGHFVSEETRRKISIGCKGHAPSSTTFRKGHIPWNKGLTKETDPRVKKLSDSVRKSYQTGKHIRYNPKIYTKERNKKLSKTKIGHEVSDTTRKKIKLGVEKRWEKDRVRLLHAIRNTSRPTKLEIDFLEFCKENGLSNVKYVGNGKFWFNVTKEFRHIQRSVNPDFILEPIKKTRTVIETMSKYWHPKKDRELRKQIYDALDVNCIIITDEQLYNDIDGVKQKLKEFM